MALSTQEITLELKPETRLAVIDVSHDDLERGIVVCLPSDGRQRVPQRIETEAFPLASRSLHAFVESTANFVCATKFKESFRLFGAA